MTVSHDINSELEHPDRRDFLYIATGAAAAVGTAAAVWPFVDQMNPNAATRALASIQVDVSSMQQGQSITVKWRGKPVFVRYRTAKEVEEAKDLLGKEKGKLDNPNFVARANPEAVETARERVVEFEGKIARLSAALKRLG